MTLPNPETENNKARERLLVDATQKIEDFVAKPQKFQAMKNTTVKSTLKPNLSK